MERGCVAIPCKRSTVPVTLLLSTRPLPWKPMPSQAGLRVVRSEQFHAGPLHGSRAMESNREGAGSVRKAPHGGLAVRKVSAGIPLFIDAHPEPCFQSLQAGHVRVTCCCLALKRGTTLADQRGESSGRPRLSSNAAQRGSSCSVASSGLPSSADRPASAAAAPFQPLKACSTSPQSGISASWAARAVLRDHAVVSGRSASRSAAVSARISE
jgi:hypothetical protein